MKKKELEKSRKILLFILGLLAVSLITVLVDIGFKVSKSINSEPSLVIPQISLNAQPGVGLIKIEGPIEMSSGENFLGVLSGAESIVDQLDTLGKDPKIKALVVRINSPGGTVAATQEIYEKIWKLRSKGLKIIASLGDVAASGGYYIASACNLIMANYGSVTGSIGVIAASPNLKELFEKLGIKMNIIKSGKYKDILASHRDLSKGEKKLLQKMIDSTYKKFLKDVAQGRGLKVSKIKPYADGRIMNGEMALECKLVDLLGPLEEAFLKVKKLANLPEDAPVYESNDNPWEQIMMSIKGSLGKNFLSNYKFKYQSLYNLEYRYLP